MPCEKTLPRCGIMWGNKQDDAPASGGTLQRRGTRKDKFRMHPHSNISPGKVEKICQFCGTIFTMQRWVVSFIVKPGIIFLNLYSKLVAGAVYVVPPVYKTAPATRFHTPKPNSRP